MLPVAYYLLKVIICSGILFGYYRLALHNKIFHRWNRFYLLAAVLMSIFFPLITINIFHTPADDNGQVIRLLNVVTTGDAFVHDASSNGALQISGEELASGGYMIVSLVFLVLLLQTLIRLRNIVRHHHTKKIEDIYFVDTDTKGTPFSFFRYIFWNNKINIDSDSGRKVFLHELAHVKEKHSADRLFMNIVMILFWSNPFFWLIRREMNMIHEFIADSEAVDNNDTAEFAAMILQVAYPQQSFGLTSNFFSSSIKRRLLMLTKMQTPSTSYISRILVLPLLATLFVAFTIRTKQMVAEANENRSIALEKKLNIVIDAGHGGTDNGARSSNGTFEKNITLALAKKIQALNNNANINIILTRSEDILQPVKEKVNFSVQKRADAFISIHVAAAPQSTNTGKGFEIFLSGKTDTASVHAQKARLLASIVTEEIGKTYTIAKEIKRRKERGIWVLDADQLTYPALLLECGYITDKKDLEFISDNNNQEKIANDLLKAIARYAKALEEDAVSFKATEEERVVYVEATGIDVSSFMKNKQDDKKPLLIVNGKETKALPASGILLATSPNGTFKGTIYPENNAKAIEKYGEPARFGAVIVDEVTQKTNTPKTASNNNQIFSAIAQHPASVKWEGTADTSVVRMEAQKLEIDKWGTEKPVPLILLNGKEISLQYLENKTLIGAKSLTYPANHPDAIKKFGARASNGVMVLEAVEVKEGISRHTDTIPRKVKSVDLTNDGQVIVIYEDNKAEKMSRQEAIDRKLLIEQDTPASPGVVLKGISQMNEPVFYLDGEEITKAEFSQLKADEIESINVWKGATGVEKYGAKAMYGVIDITTKAKKLKEAIRSEQGLIFQKVEIQSGFPGGDQAFVKYMTAILNKNMSTLKNDNTSGTCVIQFIVNTDGQVSNVEALTMKGSKLSEVAIDAIQKGPKWIPAIQNGKKVAAYRKQPITFNNARG